MAMVFDADGELAPMEKLLLLAYCEHTDAHGYCWPGMERLMAMTGMSKSTVIRTRKALEEKNLLRHQRRTTKAGDSNTNMYRVNLTKLSSLKRPQREFDDNVIGLLFEEEPDPNSGSDQPMCQPDTPPCHCGTRGGVRETPKPLPEPSTSSSQPSSTKPAGVPRTRTAGEEAPAATPKRQQTARELVKDLPWPSGAPANGKQSRLVSRAMLALASGMTVDQLRAHLTEGRLGDSAYATYWHRLSAGELPQLSVAKATRPNWCGICDERTRQREDNQGLPYRCPQCHPLEATQANR